MTAESWKPIAKPQTQPVTRDVALNECATVHAATTWQQQGYASSHDTPAVQDTFAFADAAAARTAYQDLLAAMGTCQDRSRAVQTQAGLSADAVVTQTAHAPDGAAWSRGWTGVGGISAPGRQVNHVYVVCRNATLEVVQIVEFPGKSPAYNSENDTAVLTTLAAGLDA